MYIVHPDETYGRPSAATIGFFDGVHRGHHHLFGQLRKAAAARGLDTLAVTFGEHPRQTLAADYRPHLLTTKDEKLAAFLQNPIVSTLGWLLSSDKEWSGSTTALAEKVEQFASVEIMPRSLGRQLNALNTPLRDVLGIEHTITRKAAERIHTFRRTKDMKNPRP